MAFNPSHSLLCIPDAGGQVELAEVRLCLSTKLLPVDCSKMMSPLAAQGCVPCAQE